MGPSSIRPVQTVWFLSSSWIHQNIRQWRCACSAKGGRWTRMSWRSSELRWSVWICRHLLWWILPRSFVQSKSCRSSFRHWGENRGSKGLGDFGTWYLFTVSITCMSYTVSVTALGQMVKSECEISWIIIKTFLQYNSECVFIIQYYVSCLQKDRWTAC